MSIAAIIPAFNEAARIGQVLAVIEQMECLSEVIVVDDGSTDGTISFIQQAANLDSRVRIIRHEVNRGKGQAIFSGWRAAHAALLLLVDSDLSHLTKHHLESLIHPVVGERVDMAVGLLTQNGWFNQWYCSLFPWLSGQRCLRADLLRDVSEQASAGYGFETTLQITAHRKGWRTCTVPLTGVTHPIRSFSRAYPKQPACKLWAFPNIVHAWYLSELGEWKNSAGIQWK